MKRKYIALTLSILMTGSIFMGCGKKETAEEGDKIQISYINWNLATEEENNIERRMI